MKTPICEGGALLFILFAAVLILWGVMNRKRLQNDDHQQDVPEEVILPQDADTESTGVSRRRTVILMGGTVVTTTFCALTSVLRAYNYFCFPNARRYCITIMYNQYLRACFNANDVILAFSGMNSRIPRGLAYSCMMTHRDLETLAQEKTNRPLDLDQLRRDWAELEEDDESVFYPIVLYDKLGHEYQSFTMFRRSDVVDQNYEQQMIWDDRLDGIEFWPVEVQHIDGDHSPLS
jgi:hypothetical protein